MACFKCHADAKDGEVAIWSGQKWLWVWNCSHQWDQSSHSYVQLPRVLRFDAKALEVPGTIYCYRCWDDWGQHVKPGSKYALSSTCEEMAVRLGVMFEANNTQSRKSNPFHCILCNAYFNAGARSLEMHLKAAHLDQFQQNKQKADALQKAHLNPLVGSKRKADAMISEKDFEPVLYVSGCSHALIAAHIEGRYTATKWNHGKPIYEKEQTKQPADGFWGPTPRSAFIYFWDERDGALQHGWWFAPIVGHNNVWAFNGANREAEVLTVPESGWRITFDGDIDKTLRVTASPAKGLEDLKLELRWEFLASPEGASPEDWQPMKQDMNDVLEKRWAKHWDGDDGTDFFNVESNGFTYRIDCYTMYQENLKTYRCRRIRRGEPRASMAAVLPKLMAKDAEIARLQAQNSDLFKELDKLDDKVRRLEQEKATLMDSVVEHDGQMMLQEIWRMGRQLQVKVYKEVPAWHKLYSIIKDALLDACPKDHFGHCHRIRDAHITEVKQIFNVEVWKDYEFRKKRVRKELEEGPACVRLTSNLNSEVCSWAELDPKINEILVIHGTTFDKIDQIATCGFDERLARESGLYGQGVYFTDQSCKSLQYSGAATQHVGCLIIARLVLGRPFFAGGPQKNLKIEPFLDVNDPSKGRFHSVIARPGTPTGLGPQPQVHQEYVVFDGAQAYPEMIVHFKIP
ncbi:unnamed protein product [Durusdinium trenchii]|uniref:Poly [ADP-ribose] polymerase n=1 Tax=Durusdinium trenchii TaxID=1381693 RepID=A0ABP0JXC1_9DINO